MCCVTATDQAAIDECKAYVARGGYTQDDVRIIQRDGMTLVIAKRQLWEIK